MSEQMRQVKVESTADCAVLEREVASVNPGYRIDAVENLQLESESPMGDAMFTDPVTIIVTATIAALAARMVDQWLKNAERGVVIDARTRPVTISLLRDVPAGMLVIVDKTATTVHQGAYQTVGDIPALLAKLLK